MKMNKYQYITLVVLSERDRNIKMSFEENPMSVPAEFDECDDCICCKNEKVFKLKMCSDCYWGYDTMRKWPGRIRKQMAKPVNADRQDECQLWLNAAIQQVEEFRQAWAAGFPAPEPEVEADVEME